MTGSGQLEFEEFCTLAARFLVEEDSEAMQQELREAFRLYDKEGNGYITTAVFRDILHELDDKLTPQELDMMIEEIDADGSGTLDFDGRQESLDFHSTPLDNYRREHYRAGSSVCRARLARQVVLHIANYRERRSPRIHQAG